MQSLDRHDLKRRAFLIAGGQAAAAALAGSTYGLRPVFAENRPAWSAQEQRIAETVETYDAQGNHRTATSADTESAVWLATRIRQFAVEPAFEPFAVDRVDPISCHVRIANRRIDGVPAFDANFTGADGVRGTLGELGSDADIALVETQPFTLVEPRRELRGAVADARRSRHKGVIVITRGSRPGLFLLNAPSFKTPFGPPMLQVSEVEGDWLKARAKERAEATLVTHVKRTLAQALNVTARLAGSDSSLAPLVITTPRSGWWQCASERGGGLACWLEVIRALAEAKPARECLFAAFSGHEVGFIGIDAYLAVRPDLLKRAQAWFHIGANIGAPRQPNQVHFAEPSLRKWIAAALEKQGLSVNVKAEPGSVPRGEAGKLHRDGARYVTLVCGTEVFHHTADRWPDAVDVSLLTRYASAFANGAHELANQRT